MRNSIKSRLLTALLVATFSAPVWAIGNEDNQGDFAMAGDLLIARPFGVVWTVAGSALFVVSLPFTALGGNVKQAAHTLVIGPAKETFVRCLGCSTSGRYEDPNEVSH